MAGPEGDRLLHVDMTTQTVSFEDFPEEWKLLGGRGLSAKIMTRDCDPTCDPLGSDNVLVMARPFRECRLESPVASPVNPGS